MATRAEQFKSEMQRKNRKPKPKQVAQDKRRPSNDAGARNLKSRVDHKATVVTEESLSGKPSRKSSRASSGHMKNSSMLEYASRMRSQTPQRRHATRASR
jgi:hypothetical protein